MEERIYLIGRVLGAYRSQNLIKILLDQKYQVCYNGYREHMAKNSSPIRKFTGAVVKLIFFVFSFPYKLFSIAVSDLVILLAMNNMSKVDIAIARLFNKKIMTDFYYSKYDASVNDWKNTEKDSVRAKKLKKVERKLLTDSTDVIFLNTAEAIYYSSVLGVELKNIHHTIAPLCIDEKEEVQLNYFNGSKDELSVCWWGSYIPVQGIEKILDAMRVLKSKKCKVHLYVFGDSSDRAAPYKSLIKKLDIDDYVTMMNDFTFKNGKLGKFLVDHCDLVLGNFGDSSKSKNVIANKIIDGAAMKAPVLTGESIAPQEFFPEDTFFSCQNNGEDIAAKIEIVYNSTKEDIESRVNKAYEVYKNHFSASAFEKNMNKIIHDILDR